MHPESVERDKVDFALALSSTKIALRLSYCLVLAMAWDALGMRIRLCAFGFTEY